MPKRSKWVAVGLVTFLFALSVGFWSGCSEGFDQPAQPVASQEEVVLGKQDLGIQRAMAVQERHTERFMAMPNVVGTATSVTPDGRPAVLIMLKSEINESALSKEAAIPSDLDGVPVITMVTGEIKAIKGPPGGGGGFDPTTKHRPAPNGVSLGHPSITAGTLGCLVTKNNTTYILSNNHVMANENQANIGDNILQPGPYDGGQNPGDRIAALSDYVTIVFSTSASNVVDGAIAAVDDPNFPDPDVTGATDPAAGSYGQPRSTTTTAEVRMKVQKYGRTTNHTSGKVQGINATVNVGYDSGVARFVNQIVIGGGGFSAGGDSGSLIVGQGGSNDRKPVGLLFAGGGGTTIANPIDAVLGAFGVTVVGN